MIDLETERLIVLALAIITIGLSVGAGWWLLLKRRKKYRHAFARIARLSPMFRNQSPLKSQWIKCDYTFKHRETEFSGECILPLSRFVQSVIPPGPVIIFDVRINMPVLIADDIRIVGEEGIEHHLLQFINTLRIRHSLYEPHRNELIEVEGMRPDTIMSNEESPKQT